MTCDFQQCCILTSVDSDEHVQPPFKLFVDSVDNILIRFGTKLYRQVVGIPMGTNCAPLFADLFLFCYERDFMMSLCDDKQADVINAFNTTSRYLDDILNINNVYLIW